MMKKKFRSAYRVRRILSALGIDRVQWHDPIEVAAYEAWSNSEDSEYFNAHKNIRTQYSWY